MPEEKENPIFIEADKYRSYLDKDDKALEDAIKDLDELDDIVKEQINKLKDTPPGRGTLKYLNDSIVSRTAIIAQKQSLLKERRSIKENALNIALKQSNGEDTSDATKILNQLSSLISTQKAEAKKDKKDSATSILNEANADEEILKRLGKN